MASLILFLVKHNSMKRLFQLDVCGYNLLGNLGQMCYLDTFTENISVIFEMLILYIILSIPTMYLKQSILLFAST